MEGPELGNGYDSLHGTLVIVLFWVTRDGRGAGGDVVGVQIDGWMMSERWMDE